MASRFDLEAFALPFGRTESLAMHAFMGSSMTVPPRGSCLGRLEAEFAYVITVQPVRRAWIDDEVAARIENLVREAKAKGRSSRSSIWQRRHVEVFAVDASRTRDRRYVNSCGSHRGVGRRSMAPARDLMRHVSLIPDSDTARAR